MKLKFLLVVAFLSLTATAFAQWFPGRAEVSVLPAQVAFRVFNPYAQPIVCNGQVFGQAVNGQIFTAGFLEQLLPVGDFRLAYVNALPFLPFARGWANINCRFVGGGYYY